MLVYLFWTYLDLSAALLPYILLLLLLISEFSDLMDGYLARRWDQVSDFGKILDPMADSLFRVSVFLTFTLPPISVPLLLVFIMIYRDSVISTLRTLCAFRGHALGARISGKIKAVIQGVSAIVIVLLFALYSNQLLPLEDLHGISLWICIFVAAYTLFSGFDYIIANWHDIRKALSQKKLN
jgi:CDP-diacylglycerol--glycerol-3-phosphate 3-phosphatidyltransferase